MGDIKQSIGDEGRARMHWETQYDDPVLLVNGGDLESEQSIAAIKAFT
ncbi:hypothetical protein [Enterovibrio norvegicus]|nr:hypothetical protein [Enterovibrio norvegicus]MCC4800221.1 hypothetical protein [Enterovibrio norvegicus]